MEKKPKKPSDMCKSHTHLVDMKYGSESLHSIKVNASFVLIFTLCFQLNDLWALFMQVRVLKIDRFKKEREKEFLSDFITQTTVQSLSRGVLIRGE